MPPGATLPLDDTPIGDAPIGGTRGAFPPLSAAEMAAIDAEYYHLVLREILDAGVAVAQAIKHDAAAHTIATMRGEADPRDTAAADLAVAYERVARAVRRTISLDRRISAALTPTRAGPSRSGARKRIIREVEAAIDRQRGDDTPETDDLRADFHERLDDPALEDDIATRPIPDIIADICRDLGLAARATEPSHIRTLAPRSPEAVRPQSGPTAEPAGATPHREPASYRDAGDPGPPPNPTASALSAGAAGLLLRTAASPP